MEARLQRRQRAWLSLTAAAITLVIVSIASAASLSSQTRPQTPVGELGSDSRYALLVGISDYPGEDEDLGGGPLNDVSLMTDLLVKRLGIPERNILTLTDDQATWANIVAAFRTHLGRTGKDGVAIFYFSGHGAQLPNSGNDAEEDGLDEVLVVRGSSPDRVSALRDDHLGLLGGSLDTERVLVLLDNCYSGTGTRGGRGGLRWRDIAGNAALPATLRRSESVAPGARGKRLSREAVVQMGLEPSETPVRGTRLEDPRTHVLLAASAENELSLNVPLKLDDGSRISVGLFTATLYGELARANLATVSFTDLALSLQANARRVTLQMREGPQTPQAEGIRRDALVGAYLGGK